MNIGEQELINLLQGASVSLLVTIIILAFLLRLSSYLDGWRRVTEAINEGKKQDFAAQANVVAAGTETVRIAVAAMENAITRIGDASAKEIASLRAENKAEMIAVNERLKAVERDNGEKQKTIDEQAKTIEQQDARIKELEKEVERLQKQLETKNKRRLVQTGDGHGTDVPVVAGDK